MTLEQQQAIALASARARAAQSAQPIEQPEAPQSSLADTIGRYAAIAGREVTPAAVAMGTGALAGIPLGLGGGPISWATVPAAMGVGGLYGLGAYGLSRMFGNPVIEITNSLAGTDIPTFAQGEEALKDKFYGDFGKPNTPIERIYASGVQGVVDSAGGYGMGKLAMKAASPVIKGVGEVLAQNPVSDAVIGGVTGLGVGTAREAAPDSTTAQVITGLALPFAAGTAVNAAKYGLRNSGTLGSYLTGSAGQDAEQIMALADKEANLTTRGGIFNRQASAMRSATDRVAREIQDAAQASGQPIGDAITNIDNTTAALNSPAQQALPPGIRQDLPLSPGFRATTGLASNNIGLGMMEKGMGNSEPRMVRRNYENQQAINRESAQATAPAKTYDDSRNSTQRFFTNILRGKQQAANTAQRNAKGALQSAESDLATARADIADRGSSSQRADASEAIRGSLTREQKAAKITIDEAFAKVPQDVTVDVSENTLKGVNNAMAIYKNRIAEMPAAIQDLYDIVKSGGGKMSSGVAQKNLEDLYAFASRAPAESVEARVLGELRSALDADITKVEEFSVPLREARNIYRDVMIRLFKSDASFDTLHGRGQGNVPLIKPSKTVDRYLSGRTRESAKQLNDALSYSGGKVSVADEKALEDWVLSSLGDRTSGVSGKPTPAKVQKFLSDNEAMLAELPNGITNKIVDIANKLTTLEGKVGSAQEAATAAASRAKAAGKYAETSIVGKFSSPDKGATGFAAAIESKNPASNVRRLMKIASKDKTGKATEDFKSAAKTYFSDLIKNFGSTTAEGASNAADNMTSAAKLSKQLERHGDVMKLIYTPDELSALQQTRRRLEAMTRQNRQIGSGSSTKPTEGAQTFLEEVASNSAGRGTTISNVPGVKQIRQANTVLQAFETIVGRSIKSGKEDKFYKDLKVEAMLNPEVAKILLKRKPQADANYASVFKKPAMVTWMQAWDQENNQDEKPVSAAKSQAPTAKSQAPSDPAESAPAPAARYRYENGKLVPVQ